jgi:hypothetical protein
MLEQAGFRVAQVRNRREFAIEFTKRVLARMALGGPPVLGAQLLMGERTSEMLNNTLTMIKEGVLEPVEMYAQTSP